ncbi:MAG: phosphoadenosine phosphosulfate reductase family protein [Lutibacter sp.]|jgi:3'-phosphoadenosine 5'-phosphosulfate sulfotransferase (PAPS reductase)/FAD synthetase
MKVLVAYSGGKDSQASLLWAIDKFGRKNVESVFCDTGWEHPITYEHIINTVTDLGIKHTTVRSKIYDGMIDMAEKKKRFPSSQARFCTSELKSIPFIDYVLDQDEHLIIVQGIRSQESFNRSQMKKECSFFKYYFQPYNDKGKKHTYRKKEVIEWCKKYSDDIFRPVFDWTGQQVIEYIIHKGQKPNPLYKQGFKRVGCFPCIMSGHKEVFEIINRYPERFNEIIEHENRIGSSFFKIDFVPKKFQTGICIRTGKSFTTGYDVKLYLENKNRTPDIFKNDIPISCSSYYNLCE